MKSNVLLATLLMIGATGSLMSMLPEIKDRTQMKFFLDNKDYIKKFSVTSVASSDNWPILGNVVGKKFIDIVPLNDPGIVAFGQASSQAQDKMVTVRTLWTLENRKFWAKISPVIVENEKMHLLVTMKSWDNW